MILRKLRVLFPLGLRNLKKPGGRINPRTKKMAIDKGWSET